MILDFEKAEKVRMDTWAAGDALMGAGFIREESEAAYRSALEVMAQQAVVEERERCANELEAEMKPFVIHGSPEHISRETLRMAAAFVRGR